MPIDDIIKLVLVLVLVVLPAIAVTIGIAARFAAKPIVDAIVRLRELSNPPPPLLEQRISSVEEELRQLRDGFERLASAVEFDAQLRAGDAGNVPRLPQA